MIPCISSLVQISKESDRIWGSYGQKATQNQPKIQLSAATKTFENVKLGTTYATLMKLTTIMHLHKTFNLAGDWGVNHRT